MNDVTINIFVLFAFFSLLHVSLGYIPKVGWLGQSVWTLLLLFLYVARLISRGVNTFWKCQIRQWGLEKWWLNWKSLACVVHQIPSSCLLPAPVTKKCVCVWGGEMLKKNQWTTTLSKPFCFTQKCILLPFYERIFVSWKEAAQSHLSCNPSFATPLLGALRQVT